LKFTIYLTIEQVQQVLNQDPHVLESLYKQVHKAFDEKDSAKEEVS